MTKSLFDFGDEIETPKTIDTLKLSCKIIHIKYEDIVFNPLTQLSCQNCGFFGRTFRCPPYNLPYYKIRENLKQYNNFVLIVAESELSEYERRYTQMKTKCPTLSQYRLDNLIGTQLAAVNLGKSTEDLHTIIKFIKSKYEKYIGFGSAGCHKCRPCNKHQHKPCAFPTESYSSPEGSGIDLYTTLRNIGIIIESPPIKRYIACCMVTWKE
jgi:predicted metal-binding protein